MTTDPQPIIAEVHRVYSSLTGTSTNLLIWQRDLYEFVKAGYGPDDMQEVLIWIIRENKKASEPRYHKSTSLLKLISDLRYFDAWLNEARASNRNNKPVTARDSVLMATGRSAREYQPARLIGQIMKGVK